MENSTATVGSVKSTLVVTDGKVSFRNLVIDPDKFTFKMEYSVLEGKKRKHIYQSVEGNISRELVRWFTNVFNKKVNGEFNGEKTTAFRLWLERKGIDYVPGIIRQLEFSCENRSENFDDCMFRLTLSDKYENTLNLVNLNHKKVISTKENLATGKFVNQYGYGKYQYMTRKMFRRLEVFTTAK